MKVLFVTISAALLSLVLFPACKKEIIANKLQKDEVVFLQRPTISYEFTPLDIPNDRGHATFPYDINNSGTIVGGYVSTNDQTTGFIYEDGQFTDVIVPGSSPTDGTRLAEMAENGVAVGNFFFRPGLTDYPIKRDRNGNISVLPTYPGSRALIVRDYHASSDMIVGFLQDGFRFHGFTLQGGQYNLFDIPGSTQTRLNGINSQHTLVGFYSDTNPGITAKGFILDNGAITHLLYPGARSTLPWGINNNGTIVGQWQDQDLVFHGFVYSEGVFTSVDFPGASNTLISGINNNGKIVGSYDNNTRGFYAVPQ